MRVVFNNEVLCVVDYPALGALEVFDHRNGQGAFMRESVAQTFRRDLEGFISEGREDVEDFHELLDRYGGLFFRSNEMH